LAKNADEAAEFAETLDCETVLKIVSPDILHKSDAGGVRVKLQDADAVRTAYSEIVNNARGFNPDADIRGCLVCPMVAEGIELIVGVKHDDQFGPVMMFGLGGIMVEVFKDVAFRLLPLDENDAAQMIAEVKSAVILDGFRGKNRVDKKAVCDLLVTVSRIAEAYPQIQEMDLNPVIATDDGLVAVDARILIKNTV
jgi:acetyltransferase